MSSLIEALKGARKWAWWTIKYPANIDYNFHDTITTSGLVIDIEKELSGQIPCCVEIYCDQNFTLEYGFQQGKVDRSWHRTLVLGAWHKWSNRAWKTIKVTPVASAITTVIINGTDPGGKKKG